MTNKPEIFWGKLFCGDRGQERFRQLMDPSLSEMEFESVPAVLPFCDAASPAGLPENIPVMPDLIGHPTPSDIREQLRQVHQQQQEFGEGRK